MPEANLPTSLLGWIVALAASFVGFVSGFVAISCLRKMAPEAG